MPRGFVYRYVQVQGVTKPVYRIVSAIVDAEFRYRYAWTRKWNQFEGKGDLCIKISRLNARTFAGEGRVQCSENMNLGKICVRCMHLGVV